MEGFVALTVLSVTPKVCSNIQFQGIGVCLLSCSGRGYPVIDKENCHTWCLRVKYYRINSSLSRNFAHTLVDAFPEDASAGHEVFILALFMNLYRKFLSL